MGAPPVHPPEPAYPCCLPALGRFTGCTPHEGLPQLYPFPPRAERRLSFFAEDSPSGLGRTLGKRVGLTPSRVRISYPPQREAHRWAGIGPWRERTGRWRVGAGSWFWSASRSVPDW